MRVLGHAGPAPTKAISLAAPPPGPARGKTEMKRGSEDQFHKSQHVLRTMPAHEF